MFESKATLADETEAAPAQEAGLIDGRYRLELDRPLPRFDTAGGKAYEVTDLRESSLHYYALVREPGVPHRADVARSLMKMPVANLLNPLLQEVVRPAAGQPERLVTLIEAPGGPSLAQAGAQIPINGHRLRRIVVPAIVKALTALHERKLCHRAIRPSNVFFTNESLEEIVLGDCFTAPPAADQAPHFESLERAAADAHGRGPGNFSCDIYAAGATLLAAHLGRDLAAGRDRAKLLAARVTQGSFWALTGGTEIPGILGSLFRGMLNDDTDERWTLDEIGAWLDSALPSRRSVSMIWTFARPVVFRRETYSDRRMLADAFARYPLEAAPFIRNLDFESWVQQLITTELFSERHEKLIDARADVDLSSSRHGDHALVARVVAHLDPWGPARFRDISAMIDGIGPALAHAHASGDDKPLDAFKHLFDMGVLPAIIEIVADRNEAVGASVFELQQAARQVRAGTLGGGLLRVLYDLNPSLPCLSPHLADRWIATPGELLRELEANADGGGEVTNLLNPHILAFFASRVDGAERHIDLIGTARKDRARALAAIVDFFAFLQTTLDPGPLPRLSAHFAKGLRPSVERLRSRTRRAAVLRALERLGEAGDLPRMSESLDLRPLIARDDREFAAARNRFNEIETRIRRLSRPVRPSDHSIQAAGYRLSAAVGWLVTMGTVLFLLLGR